MSMRLLVVLAIMPCTFCIFSSRVAEGDALQSTAQAIADQISGEPGIQTSLYAPSFLQGVPVEKISDLYASMRSQSGPVLHVIERSRDSTEQGRFEFDFKQSAVPVSLTIEAAVTHRVIGLWFGPPVPRMRSLREVSAQLAALPGQVSFEALRLDDGALLASLNPDRALAIGSTFKLYVLAELAEEGIPWDKVTRLQERYKSLPSGDLQKWPDDSPLTVHTLAVQMISQSDNTAADHLLALVGRENVEDLPRVGMKDPSADIPFLGTLEIFRLKADAALRHEYLAADVAGRRALLDKLSNQPKPTMEEFESLNPVAIDQIEWFASAADLCRVMGCFDKRNDPIVQSILAVNPGLQISPDQFSYIGYKGGSEPGVLNMTWLLRSRSGRHYALSATWNDPAKDVDLQKFAGIMLAATDVLESVEKPATNP
jgi:beta-lactamase class A